MLSNHYKKIWVLPSRNFISQNKDRSSPDRAILAHMIMNESAISFQSDEERGSLPLLHKLRNFPSLTVEIVLSKSIAANSLFTGIQKLWLVANFIKMSFSLAFSTVESLPNLNLNHFNSKLFEMESFDFKLLCSFFFCLNFIITETVFRNY